MKHNIIRHPNTDELKAPLEPCDLNNKVEDRSGDYLAL